MDLSMKWLHDFVDCKETGRDFAEALTMSGSKVEKWACERDGIEEHRCGQNPLDRAAPRRRQAGGLRGGRR